MPDVWTTEEEERDKEHSIIKKDLVTLLEKVQREICFMSKEQLSELNDILESIRTDIRLGYILRSGEIKTAQKIRSIKELFGEFE